MSVERIVRVSCDAQFEPGVEDLRRGPCEVDWGDVHDTAEEALRVVRGAGWTVGRGPDGRAGYVRCPACADAWCRVRRLRVVARRVWRSG